MLLLWVPRLFKNWNPKKKKIKIKIGILGTSLVFRGLRISLPMQGTRVQSLVGEVRPHRLWGNSGAGRAHGTHLLRQRPCRLRYDRMQPTNT